METKDLFKTGTVKTVGGDYTIRELSMKQRKELTLKHKKRKDLILMQVHLVKLGCDQLNDVSEDDIMALPGTMFDDIAVACSKLSGLYDEDDAGNGQS